MKKRALSLLAMLVLVLSGTLVAAPVSAAPCWTSFSPGSPQGDPMDQTYHNCGPAGTTAFVAPYYVKNGVVFFFEGSCEYVDAQEEFTWEHDFTEVGAQYSTATCDTAWLAWDSEVFPYGAGSEHPCNTSFEWDGPELHHYYGYCGVTGSQRVTTAWRYANGNLHASPSTCLFVNGNGIGYSGKVAHWHYTGTEPANYTTVRCAGEV